MNARRVLLALSVCASAAACSSGGGHVTPPASTPVSSTPVVTVSTAPASAGTSVAPTMPSAATAAGDPTGTPSSGAAASYPATKEGAYAIVKALYAAQDVAIHKRDATEYLALTAAACSCRQIKDYVQKLLDYHEHIEGEHFSNIEPNAFVRVAKDAQVGVSYDFSSGKIVAADGQLAETDPAAHGTREVVSLVPVGDEWRVESIHRLADGTH